MRTVLAILAAVFVLAYPSTLLANTYQYQYTGTQFTNNALFTFTTNALITSDITVTPTSCSYDPGTGPINCVAIEVDHFNQGDFFLEPPSLSQNAVELFTGFSLTDIGTQSNLANSLTISVVPSPVPEPSSILLLTTGTLLMTGIARRRFARQ